ncbi:probable LRR receptor-like serine/threonine-protein kinase At1g56140 isoform X1 [Magnolia sinica]|uniref:probable LRR receptor-like serine/threonine-protein kinase At1g56140 isoform X1 n=1 Tax=Magnolia sinica TaxID=86752 RepID=UPI0026583FA3|nr:probable LRR receptor-like serine/threonine-protein kinase At1g56140 isoform X1 [Magnolia sinica]
MMPSLFSKPFEFLLLSSLLLFILPLPTNTADPLWTYCPSTVNYTPNSTFGTNLNRLLSSLSSNASLTGFSNLTIGENPNRIYALAQCRGDTTPQSCGDCLNTARQEIVESCPNRTAITWYDNCLLRYSNEPILSSSANSPMVYMMNTQNISNPDRFNLLLGALMNGVVSTGASDPDRYATSSRNVSNSQTIYGLAQCTKDLSMSDCNACLQNALDRIPTCCNRRQGGRVLGPSCNLRFEIYKFYDDLATAPTPPPTPTSAPVPPSPNTTTTGRKRRSSRTAIIMVVPIVVVVVLIFAIATCFLRRRHMDEDKELLKMGTKPNTFSYSELRTATGDFSLENKLGMGGFGAVYKGTLPDGRIVAAKQLSVASHDGKRQFVAEIVTISAVQHRNLVKLYGCCVEGDKRLLVYEYLENRSLDHALFGDSNLHLNWPTRYRICLGTARGLTYLHEESRLRIVHRDVKASNILLDADLNPKISDFGLAKLYDDKKTHISTRVAGTIWYLAPEYALRGHLTEKADVFGFGVVALEILSGRPNTDTSLDQDKIYLLEWAWTLHEANRPLELIDPTLSEFDKGEALRMIGVALLCTQTSPVLRPPMSRVVAMLLGDVEVSSVTSRPSYLTLWQFNDLTNSLSDCMSRGSMGITTDGPRDTSNKSSWSTPAERLPLPTGPFLQEISVEREG